MNGDSEELLRLFIDQAPVPIAMFDRGMRYIAASRRWVQRLWTWRGRIGVARHTTKYFTIFPERWLAIHRRGLAGRDRTVERDRFDRADGTVQWLRWEVRPWYREDEQGGIIIFGEDVPNEASRTILNLDVELEGVCVDAAAQLGGSVASLQQALDEAERLARSCANRPSGIRSQACSIAASWRSR